MDRAVGSLLLVRPGGSRSKSRFVNRGIDRHVEIASLIMHQYVDWCFALNERR